MTTVQPSSTHTTVIVQQPRTVDKDKTRPWRSGICGCFDNDCDSSCIVVCVLSLFGCLECYGCHLASKMYEHRCVCACVPGYLTALRTRLRTEEDIEGSICNDCVVSTFCRPCVMCQMSRELDNCGY